MHSAFIPAMAHPITVNALVAIVDQAQFMANSRGRPSAAVFAELNEFYLLTERVIAAADGLVIKFMGDAALIVFPAELADLGITTLLNLKAETDAWFRVRRIASTLHVNVHFGEVTLGKMGTIDRLDGIGETVNECALLPHRGFTLSEPAYAHLSPDQQQAFVRAAPPATTYHPRASQ